MRGRVMQARPMGDINEPHSRGGAAREQTQDAQGAVNALRSIGLLGMRHALLGYEGAPVFRSRDGGRLRHSGDLAVDVRVMAADVVPACKTRA